MTIEAAVYNRLATGSIGATVAVGQRLQGSALPAVTIAVEEIEPIRSLDGTAGLYTTRVRVSSIAATYASARTVANAVVARLSGWTGTVGATAVVASRHYRTEPEDLVPGEGEEDLPAECDEIFVIHHS